VPILVSTNTSQEEEFALLKVIKTLPLILIASCSAVACADTVSQCPPPTGVALQVLGSGGPIADDRRASSGYVVWVDGRSRFLIDAGGGTFLRFGEAGARFSDLDFIGVSHFHTDHSADFPALLKSGYFSGRERALTVAGPDAGGPFPGLRAFLASMLDPGHGAYGYLSGYLDGSGGLVKIEAIEVSSDESRSVSVFDDIDSKSRVQAMHVPHGIVPAIAYRVDIGGAAIVFSSDQNGSDSGFVEFAKDATLLVMHMPIPEGATGGALQLHARPTVIADIASKSAARRLVLSHFMARSLNNLEENVEIVAAGYDGPISVAKDLDCFVVDD